MADEQAFLAPASALLAGRPIASPFQFLFSGEDNLRVVIINAAAGVTVNLDGRYLPIGGTPQAFSQSFKPTADRQPSTFDFGFGAGYLLNCSVVVTGGSPFVGQTYVMVQIIRGLGGATLVLGCLLGGYVTVMQHVAYPGSPIVSSTDGEPSVRSIVGTTPAVAGEFSEACPAGARWELLSVIAPFTTSAVAGTRAPNFAVNQAGSTTQLCVSQAGQVPSYFNTWFWGPNIPPGVTGGVPIVQQPFAQRTIMRAGDNFQSVTSGMLAGDQWGAPRYTVREWLEAA